MTELNIFQLLFRTKSIQLTIKSDEVEVEDSFGHQHKNK